jgi:protease-4
MKTNELLLVLLLLVVLGMMLFATALAVYAIYILTYPQECVGVIEINGVISTETSSGGLFGTPTIGSGDVVKQIQEAESRGEIKAVVFEVNSPGGSVVASKEIYEAVRDLRKPKVAYFREVAASGAYYISAGTNYIISEPDALTGNIGVVATFEDMSGLFEKLGINYTIFKSGELKDMGSPYRPASEKEKELMKQIINEVFDEFKKVVIEGRGSRLNMEKFEEILDGRILTGRQALSVGLVDEIGNENEALKLAAKLGRMTPTNKPRVCRLSSRNPVEEIFGEIADGVVYFVRSFISTNIPGRVGVSY